jgi:hypothetical protein
VGLLPCTLGDTSQQFGEALYSILNQIEWHKIASATEAVAGNRTRCVASAPHAAHLRLQPWGRTRDLLAMPSAERKMVINGLELCQV